MKTVCVLIAVIAEAYGASLTDKIVGGSNAHITQYPSAVQIDILEGRYWKQSCGGTILNARWIMSAAHCFDARHFTSTNRRIRAGATMTNSGGTIVNIENRINHHSYGVASNKDADISVARLSRELTYSSYIQPGTIPFQDTAVTDGVAVTIAGWGSLKSGGPAASQLQAVSIYTVNRSICKTRFSSIGMKITNNMICAGMLDVGGKDGCQGDSGGPVYYGGLVVGVVSWGVDCADTYYPGVNTQVSSFTDWIVTNVVY